MVKSVATPSPITERDAEDNRRSDIEGEREKMLHRIQNGFPHKEEKAVCRLVPEAGILPNLDLDFVFLTFLKNILFLYLGSNQVSKLLKNGLKIIGGRTNDGR